MNLKPTYKATTKGGKFKIVGATGQEWTAELLRLFPGQDLTLTVSKRRKTRSNQQNKWYWGVCIPVIRERLVELGNDGLTTNDVHYFLKDKFLEGRNIVMPCGEVMRGKPTTTTLSTSEAMDYYAQIQKWSAEILELIVPDPNEQIAIFEL